MSTHSDAISFDEFQRKVDDLPRHAPPTSLSGAEQVERAKAVMISKLDSRIAMEMETCIHCGMCSEACHFFEGTRDPKYTPIHKVHLLRTVYRRELSPLRLFNRLFIERYYAFKRRMGYSELEISQKREALENVLIPYRLQENRNLLLGAGFREVEVFFKWYNFAGFVAVK